MFSTYTWDKHIIALLITIPAVSPFLQVQSDLNDPENAIIGAFAGIITSYTSLHPEIRHPIP